MNIKTLLPWLLVFIVTGSCASLVTFSQIQGPLQAGTVVTDASGHLSVSTTSASPAPPKIAVTKVLIGTPNSYPLPAGTTTCIVSQAVMQSLNEDYAITGGNVVFNTAPSVGAVVQLACW